MSFPLITPELIDRIERFHARFNLARMEAPRALDGNPYGGGAFATCAVRTTFSGSAPG
jgi:hypothetical protein